MDEEISALDAELDRVVHDALEGDLVLNMCCGCSLALDNQLCRCDCNSEKGKYNTLVNIKDGVMPLLVLLPRFYQLSKGFPILLSLLPTLESEKCSLSFPANASSIMVFNTSI